jgi:hypothetical protein
LDVIVFGRDESVNRAPTTFSGRTDVEDDYNNGDGLQNPWLDEDIRPLALSEKDIDDVVAFLASLTSRGYEEAGRMGLARQRASRGLQFQMQRFKCQMTHCEPDCSESFGK